MAQDFQTAQMIGTAYVCGLALLALVFLVRGRSSRSEVSGDAFASALGHLASAQR